ncbi:molybdopterin-dependent oxidoreductase [Dactylosporangium sucinum]|uniref:molybdopterin-dependent oxidoreductase n=1 Tax=Dactylosporangium sucinum TaxID=1424081 RepID=UPI00167DDEB8|nr:molybdopterin cofactor-binding domain-containing protein [Dactylosporangium sucinum]
MACTVNGAPVRADAPTGLALNAFLSMHGYPVNTGCDVGQCGHCLVRLDGELVRSCLVLAAQCEDAVIETVQGADPPRQSVRDWMSACGALQCGHCSPAFVLAMGPDGPLRPDRDVRSALSDVVCRCTGYTGLARAAAGVLSGARPEGKGRVEDERLLTGRGTFVGGRHATGQLWARIVRSARPHARLRAVDITAAAACPGVAAVFTGADLPPSMRSFERGLPGPAEPVLATATVRYAGEPVAVVLAEDPAAAEDAAAAVVVHYDELPLLTVPADAGELPPDDPSWLPEQAQWVPGQDDRSGDRDPVVITRRFTLARQTGLPMENRGVLAVWDAAAAVLTIHGFVKLPRANAAVVAAAIGLTPAQVHTPVGDVGGGFGVRGELYPEELLAAWAAHRLGRPVKWAEDRAEHLRATNHSRGQVWEVTMSAERTGRLLDADVTLVQDAGAYARPLTALVPYLASAMFPGPYRLRSYRARVRSLLTNRTPIGTVRAPGRFEANFVRERMIDMLAEELGLDPVRLRSQNLLGAADMPYDAGTVNEGPVHYDSGDFRAAFDEAVARAGRWAPRDRPDDGLLRGTAVVPFVEKAGLGGPERAIASVLADGAIAVQVASSPSGQGHETTLAAVAADELGLTRDRVRVVFPAGESRATGLGTFASRTAMHTGNAVLMACRRLKAMVLERAGGCSLRDGTVLDAAGRPVTTLARLAAATGAPLTAEGEYTVDAHTYPYGAVTCGVAVDPELLQVRVERLAISCDVGRALDLDIVHGQLIGGLVQGVSAALYEELPYAEDGRPLADGLEHYLVALAADVPDVEVSIIEPAPLTAASPVNPLGVKGIGEAGMAAAAAAVAAAVCTAMPALNARLTAVPMTPSALFAAAGGTPSVTDVRSEQ